MQTKHPAILLLGTNLGDRLRHIQAARREIADRVGDIKKESSVYETEPWGVTDQPTYLNAVVIVQTTLAPNELLAVLKMIEKLEGRTDRKKYAPRTLDIDILFYDGLVFHSKELTIPHPKIPLRRFALIPLAEVMPDFVHPQLRKSIRQLLAECTDGLQVKPL